MRQVVWSAAARQDYFDILRYVADSDPVAAEKIADIIEKTGYQLGVHSTGRPGRVVGTYEKSVPGLRYVIAYAITSQDGQETVSIVRVIHTSRNWPAGEWPD
jgi:plasmid stabilization system protein ParE